MAVQAFFLAAIWGALPLMLLPKVEPMYQLIIACLVTGMISGGAFTLSTVPRAALTYTWTMAFASAGALAMCENRTYLITAGFLLVFAVFMARNLVAHGSLFLDNLKAQLQLERQTEIISLLLKEFQENASDWLWQTDTEGRLIHVPQRFAEVAQLPLSRLEAAGFAETPKPSFPAGGPTVAGMVAAMEGHQPLHEVVVHVV